MSLIPDHTFAMLRGSSTLLSTVLGSSACFFRTDLFPSLLQHSRTLIDRGLIAGSTDIAFVQSLMIATYFKVRYGRIGSSHSRLRLTRRLGGRLAQPYGSHTSLDGI